MNLIRKLVNKPVEGGRRVVDLRRTDECVHGVGLAEPCEECRLNLNPPMRERIEGKQRSSRRRK